jgi:hypothetical protein
MSILQIVSSVAGLLILGTIFPVVVNGVARQIESLVRWRRKRWFRIKLHAASVQRQLIQGRLANGCEYRGRRLCRVGLWWYVVEFDGVRLTPVARRATLSGAMRWCDQKAVPEFQA